MDFDISYASFDDITAPAILYKYRQWDKVIHRTILSQNTVYLAAPSSFEDEKELRNYKRYDLLTDAQIYNQYLKLSHERNKYFSRAEHRKHARDWKKKNNLKDAKHTKNWQENFFKEYDRRVGILSLTQYNAELTMWNYYSDNGKGFCVGFDTSILFRFMGGGCEVNYPEAGLPVIYANDEAPVVRWKQFYNKELKWEFEKEYRVDKFLEDGFTDADRIIILPKQCIKEVIFGWQMPAEERQELINTCEQNSLQVDYYETILNDNLSIIPLPE